MNRHSTIVRTADDEFEGTKPAIQGQQGPPHVILSAAKDLRPQL